VQFSTGAVRVMPVGSCGINENRFNESCSLFSTVKEILPFFFLHFSSDLEEVSTGNVHKTVFIDFKARKRSTLLNELICILVRSFV
jgi:hypothetical protein